MSDVRAWLRDGKGVGVMLREVQWQLRDMGRIDKVEHPDPRKSDGAPLARPDFSYLLRAAAAVAAAGQALRGDEEFPTPEGGAYRTLVKAYSHVLPRVGPEWMPACVEVEIPPDQDLEDLLELLGHLERLEFAFASGRVRLFPILREEHVPPAYRSGQDSNNDKRAWGVVMPSWHLHVAEQRSRFDLKCLDHDLSEAPGTYVCAAAYAMLVHVEDEVPYVLAVKQNQKGIYELPGGGVECFVDEDVLQAASREWAEEVNPTNLEDFRLENAAMLAEGSQVDHHVIALRCYIDEDPDTSKWPGRRPPTKPNRSRPCKAFVLMRAKKRFYENTRDGGEITLPQEYCLGCGCRALHYEVRCECGRPCDPETRRRTVTEGLPYIECTDFTWLRWDGKDEKGHLCCSKGDKAAPAAIVHGALTLPEVQRFLGLPEGGRPPSERPPSERPPSERPRLNLRPRSKAAAGGGGYVRDARIFGTGRARGEDQP